MKNYVFLLFTVVSFFNLDQARSQIIISDVDELVELRQVIWDTVNSSHFSRHVHIRFQPLENSNFYYVKEITSINADDEDIQFNMNPLFLDILTGELVSDNKVVAYYCGNSTQYEAAENVSEFRHNNEEADLRYSKPCSTDRGFVLDTKAKLVVSYENKKISLTGERESINKTDGLEIPQPVIEKQPRGFFGSIYDYFAGSEE